MATATESRKLSSPKYPGWTIERTGRDSFLMSRPGGVFAIGVGRSEEHGWEGVLLTKQRGGWEPARTPYRHSVIGCVAEVERREKQIAKFAARPLGR